MDDIADKHAPYEDAVGESTLSKPDFDYDHFFKILVVGDSGVGKTVLLHRAVHNVFLQESVSTVGVDCETITCYVDGKTVTAQIWDTAGQERYHSITQAYYKNAKGALLMYDITRRDSFKHIENWLYELRGHNPEIVVLVVGNKIDLSHIRQVPTQEARELCNTGDLFFMETSAKDATNIALVFTKLLTELYYKSISAVKIDPSKSRSGSLDAVYTGVDGYATAPPANVIVDISPNSTGSITAQKAKSSWTCCSRS